jgi:hypothetical protein
MKTTTFAVLSISALVVALAIPMSAQTMRLTANIPFEFMVAGKTLPAGDYSINTEPGMVRLNNFAEHAGALSLFRAATVKGTDPATATKLVFHKYGDRYFLSEVLNGYARAGAQLPESRDERELTKTASASAPETVTVLASLR